MKLNNFRRTAVSLSVAFYMLVFLVTPTLTKAATDNPTCILLINSKSGVYADSGKSEVLQVIGDPLQIFWLSSGASKAENKNGNPIPLYGPTIKNPQTKTTYTYIFKNHSNAVECSVVVHPVKGSISTGSLTTNSKQPSISGKATNLKVVKLAIYKVGTKTLVYESGSIKVLNGSWKHTVDQSLANGQYDLVLQANEDWELNKIAAEILSIGKISASLPGTIVVQPIPLLTGGIARSGETINLLYLQMLNVSLNPVTITGIKLKQNGSATTDSIKSLMATDDTNKANGVIGDNDTSPFESGVATIPITLTLQPQETRLFTLKAALKNDISDFDSDILRLEVAAVSSRSSIKGTFPIRGVTWTLAD